jgi:malto-oligosyltrehalose synthase/4-alpha-glucanotransferase
MFNPISTYRIQFHKGFTFRNFRKLIPYLHELGVKTIYASPIFEAVPGSNHGYDVVNPHRINPEIGTLEELQEISNELKQKEMYWLQDIVPNHMAFHPDNSWLMDILEKGPDSPYVGYFDIIKDVPELQHRLMVPFLRATLSEVIERGELRLTYNAQRFYLDYDGQLYPINRTSTLRILRFQQISAPAEIKHLLTSAEVRDSLEVTDKLSGQVGIETYIRAAVEKANKNLAQLHEIADEQYYQLCFWQDSEKFINYRRFFTVNGLICLNIQDEAVFDDYHVFIKELLDKQIIQGLRVDHVDGLYDPQQYVGRLRKLAGDDAFIVVEKILGNGEQFPSGWPVQGSTGYDFLATVNNLFTSSASKSKFTAFYRSLVKKNTSLPRAIHEKKAAILYKQMNGELENLQRLLSDLQLATPKLLRRIGHENSREAIAELLIRCPVYRYYGNVFPLSRPETAAIKALLKDIVQNKPLLTAAVSLLRSILTGKIGKTKPEAALHFYQRCMQFTSPLMAKGVEDTFMYTYDRFITHNEVGDSPAEFGLKINQFHKLMESRQAHWPASMNATATHDTKRGEDLRARLNVLSDIPDIWIEAVKEWQEENKQFKKEGAPDANDEYLIYQTLAGMAVPDGKDEKSLAERLSAYLSKALREAKVHTQWAAPDETYEKAAIEFSTRLLNPESKFRKGLMALQSRINDHFILNSVAQLLLKFTCPGVPDIYQGCELWDFSLVDPDNRRPVDFQLRAQQLKALRSNTPSQLWDKRQDGSIKLWLTDKLLHERIRNTDLFAIGNYIPLKVKGQYNNNLIAYARCYLRNWILVVAPLHTSSIVAKPFPGFDWEDTAIALPDEAPLEWRNAFTHEQLVISGEVNVNDLLKRFPIGFMTASAPQDRGAGVIMHITSLPSRYGVGDLGSEAKKFADFLRDAHQRYWQLLPVNPVSEPAGFSPYSGYSSMAGNTLLISPDELVVEGLLDPEELPGKKEELSHVDFSKGYVLKKNLFDLAYDRFMKTATGSSKTAFNEFKITENYWLNDFALFEVLKSKYHGLPWYEWPGQLKLRDRTALAECTSDHQTEIEQVKWLQYMFSKQWSTFKKYSNQSGIRLFGDLPFYVSYDSVDVWTNPHLFKLDSERNMLAVAGVPPDYFNSNGQLWGMPVYNWEELESDGFQWWIQRIKKNQSLFDLIRLDHFRAFYDYWEVSANEKTAINGKWVPGPGIAFIDAARKALGNLHLIAEDLGDLSPGVYTLRDQAGLAGIKVLQFAFGQDMAVSPHIPHNYPAHSVAYTGTHDNNTTTGWWVEDTTALERHNLSIYARSPINKKKVVKLMTTLCYGSVAEIAIIPMQDLLGLGRDARMNVPALKEGNWKWQLSSNFKPVRLAKELRHMVKLYNR